MNTTMLRWVAAKNENMYKKPIIIRLLRALVSCIFDGIRTSLFPLLRYKYCLHRSLIQSLLCTQFLFLDMVTS
jgi:hypothetical protein